MKKRVAALAVAMLSAAVLLTGCGEKTEDYVWEAAENSVYVSRSGQVRSAMIHTAEQANDLYTQEELSQYVSEAVDSYNQEHKAQAEAPLVTLESCTLEGQTGKAVFAYASPEDFVEFSKENEDNTHGITALAAEESKEGIRVTVTGPGVIYTEGKIIQASNGVTVKEDHAAVMPEEESYIIFK